ncbi:hypothetical protein D1BOALGB6SA_3525 [Olavius sp. associated proteobacterium Delta 1]|nr:hypothetical protein D1BOALGB6SA_3525 [Olavius sp. associated proteobacterium Delta 1]
MENENIEILSDAMKEYFGDYELEELCTRFGLTIDYMGIHPNRKKLVNQLISQKYRDNHQRFLETILPKLLKRCEERIRSTTWEVNVFDEHMLPQLKKLQNFFNGQKSSDLKDQITNHFFTGRAKLAEFFNRTKTALTIIDTQVGKTTFECLEGVKKPIRLLISQSEKDIIDDIGGFLSEFRARGHELEIRRHLELNDRFFIFNGRLWMASCSLVDAGQMTLSIIECVDTKPVVVKEIGRKWREARVFLK